MIAIFIGYLALIVGFFLLILPLLITELSRNRDWITGTLFMIFAVVIINDYDRLDGSLIIALVSLTLIIGKMMIEISIVRWQFLTDKEKQELISFHRLSKSLKELSKVFLALLSFVRGLFTLLIPKKKEALIQKKWVRKDEIPSEKGALSVNLEEQDSSKVKIESSLKEKTPFVERIKSSQDP